MAANASTFLFPADAPPSKRSILECALRLFVRDGLCETGIRAIAAESGYTNPALYKFFASKEALALHLFEQCYARIAAAVHDALTHDRFDANVRALAAVHASLVDDSLDAVLYVNETLRQFWPKASRAARRHSLIGDLRGLVQQGVRQGAVPRSVDGDLAVAALLGTMAQVARMVYFGELRGPCGKRAQRLERLFSAILQETRP